MKTLSYATLLLAFFSLAAQAQPASHDLWEKAGHRFTPEVEAAYLAENKAAALAKLKLAGQELPADFLAWIDADPVIKTSVYGTRKDASGILVILRSLELDLGQAAVRGQWTQLALAMAVAHGKEGGRELARTSLTPRLPLVLAIGGDPRVRVDTHAKDRPLDANDHIVNFLADHRIEEEIVVGWKEVLPELKYDDKGVAIPQPKAKPKKEAIREKRSRPLRAADVIASADLEAQFNAYMAAHDHPEIKVNCGGADGARLNWRSTQVGKVNQAGIRAAFDLFLAAYKAKGLFPKDPDPVPTLGERCAFLIRNFGHVFSDAEKVAKKISWPRFPLDQAPWPVLVMIAHDAQPLRERQEAWERYRDKGILVGYGEYTGGIAQNDMMQRARRLTPFAFNYGSLQMMLKDGGVCGTMANIAVRGNSSLGVPAATAGQPGHCAFVAFGFNPKTAAWNCHGGQYATGGDAQTNPHTPWSFGDSDAPRAMVYHQSVAQSVNFGLQSFLDAQAAHAFYGTLSKADQQAHGKAFLCDAITKAPYALFLANDAAALTNPADLVAFLEAQLAAYPKGKPGCPEGGLPAATVKNTVFAKLAALPAPKDPAQAKAMLDFLTANQCAVPAVIASYKVAAFGLPAVLAETEAAFKAHLAGARTQASAAAMESTLAATAARITDKKARMAWAKERFAEIQGHEMFFTKAGRGGKLVADKSAATLAKLCAQKLRLPGEQVRSALEPVSARFAAHVASVRTPATCRAMAAELETAHANALKLDPDEAKRFADALAAAMAGHETFLVKNKPQRDPCADTLAKMPTPVLPAK